MRAEVPEFTPSPANFTYRRLPKVHLQPNHEVACCRTSLLQALSQLIRLITRIVTASVAATMGKRKAAPMESALPDDHEQRAAQLRAQVEALAREPMQESPIQQAARAREAVPEEQGRGLPMLIHSTESGIYLKWSLMLQDQLRQLKGAYDAIKAENASLRQQLGLPSQPAPTAPAPATTSTTDYPLSHSRDVSFTNSEARTEAAYQGDGCGRQVSVDTAIVPHSGSDENLCNASSSQHQSPGLPVVEKTPSQTEMENEAEKKLRASRDMDSGAEALLSLGSPMLSPKTPLSSHRCISPAVLGGSSPVVSSAFDPLSRAAAMPPPPPIPPSPRQSLLPLGGSTLEGRSALLSSLSQPNTPNIGGRLTEHDELLADLLSSPSLLMSPQLSTSLQGYLDKGRDYLSLPNTPKLGGGGGGGGGGMPHGFSPLGRGGSSGGDPLGQRLSSLLDASASPRVASDSLPPFSGLKGPTGGYPTTGLPSLSGMGGRGAEPYVPGQGGAALAAAASAAYRRTGTWNGGAGAGGGLWNSQVRLS